MNVIDLSRILIIDKKNNRYIDELIDLLQSVGMDAAIETDLGSAIHRMQTERFDVIVLDANVKGMAIDKTIKILKDIDSEIKIIVKTEKNSKELEAKIRNESIYYYHLESFGKEDLKLAIESAVKEKLRMEYGDGNNSGEKKLVFIIDEDDVFIEVHKSNLETHFYRVEVCFNADEAIREIKEKRPDLLMVDMNIPVGSDGSHFMEMLMRDEQMIEIPVLIFMAKDGWEKYGRILNEIRTTLPTWTILEKPIKIEDVIPRVEILLNDVADHVNQEKYER